MMKQGDRITKARVATLALVFVAVIASLAFDLGLGTPSSFGLGQFFLLCPLGGIEALLASKALVPVTPQQRSAHARPPVKRRGWPRVSAILHATVAPGRWASSSSPR